MRKNAFIGILICGIAIIMTQCKKEPQQGKYLGELILSNEELSYFPYKLNDTLTFKNSAGNTNKLWVTSVDRKSYPVYTNRNTNSDYYNAEQIDFRFTDQYGAFQLISMRKQIEVQGTYVYTRFSPPNLTTNNNAYTTFISYMDSYKFSASSDIYHPVFSIFNKTFYTVYEQSKDYVGYNSIDLLQSIYHAKNIGIVGFKTKTGVKWCLDN